MSNPDSAEDIAAEIEAFAREHFFVPVRHQPALRTVHLWEHGIVDSTGVVELIVFLERTYQISLSPEIMSEPSFTTIEGIASLVVKLRAQAR